MLRDIKPKLKIDQVFSLETMMNVLEGLKPRNLDEKVAYSVSIDIAEKVHKIYVKTTKRTDLFSTDKKLNFNLKFHEGYTLAILIATYLKTLDKESKSHNDLHQLVLFLQDEFAK